MSTSTSIENISDHFTEVVNETDMHGNIMSLAESFIKILPPWVLISHSNKFKYVKQYV